MELRRELGIEPKDGMEVFVDGEDIIVEKYRPQCVFCGEHEHLRAFGTKSVCVQCARNVGTTAGG